MTLSVVISAHNEEEMLKDCLDSVTWADEIVVVDNKSVDRTSEIAEEDRAKVFRRPNNPLMLNINKNFGCTKATGGLILSLDADERISKELQEEIEGMLHK